MRVRLHVPTPTAVPDGNDVNVIDLLVEGRR